MVYIPKDNETKTEPDRLTPDGILKTLQLARAMIAALPESVPNCAARYRHADYLVQRQAADMKARAELQAIPIGIKQWYIDNFILKKRTKPMTDGMQYLPREDNEDADRLAPDGILHLIQRWYDEADPPIHKVNGIMKDLATLPDDLYIRLRDHELVTIPAPDSLPFEHWGYAAALDQLPQPLRDRMRYGNFTSADKGKFDAD